MSAMWDRGSGAGYTGLGSVSPIRAGRGAFPVSLLMYPKHLEQSLAHGGTSEIRVE